MDNKKETNMVELYHDMGKMPDRYYYQLNGKSAQENYADQRIQNNYLDPEDDDYSAVHITSEVRIKK